MHTPYDPSRHIACDYKSTGSELLNLLRCEFDHPSLDSLELDELVGELANDLASDCFAPLARLLVPSGLQLWQIDFYEDTLYVALVPDDEVAAFEQYWRVDYLNEPDAVHFAPRLRRVKVAQARGGRAKAAKQAQPAAVTPAQPKTGLVVDTVDLFATPTLDVERSVSLMRRPYSDHPDNGKFFDFSVWPPRPLSLTLPGGTGDPHTTPVWLPVYRYMDRNIWACYEPGDRRPGAQRSFRLAQLYDIEGWPPVWLGGGASLTRSGTDPKWIHDVMLHVSKHSDERGQTVYEVIRVTKTACEVWYRSHLPLQAFPFGDAVRCVIVEDNQALAIAEGPIGNADFVRLSEPLYPRADGVIALEGNTVVYFTRGPGSLRMHKFDLDTREESTTLLSGFGHKGKIDGRPCISVGNLFIQQGHEDWWILNHKSNQFGRIDIALLWNARTDETIKIEQEDIALHQPTVLYQRSLGRYLAMSGERLALLCEFDALYAAKEKRILEWRAFDRDTAAPPRGTPS